MEKLTQTKTNRDWCRDAAKVQHEKVIKFTLAFMALIVAGIVWILTDDSAFLVSFLNDVSRESLFFIFAFLLALTFAFAIIRLGHFERVISGEFFKGNSCQIPHQFRGKLIGKIQSHIKEIKWLRVEFIKNFDLASLSTLISIVVTLVMTFLLVVANPFSVSELFDVMLSSQIIFFINILLYVTVFVGIIIIFVIMNEIIKYE